MAARAAGSDDLSSHMLGRAPFFAPVRYWTVQDAAYVRKVEGALHANRDLHRAYPPPSRADSAVGALESCVVICCVRFCCALAEHIAGFKLVFAHRTGSCMPRRCKQWWAVRVCCCRPGEEAEERLRLKQAALAAGGACKLSVESAVAHDGASLWRKWVRALTACSKFAPPRPLPPPPPPLCSQAVIAGVCAGIVIHSTSAGDSYGA